MHLFKQLPKQLKVDTIADFYQGSALVCALNQGVTDLDKFLTEFHQHCNDDMLDDFYQVYLNNMEDDNNSIQVPIHQWSSKR